MTSSQSPAAPDRTAATGGRGVLDAVAPVRRQRLPDPAGAGQVAQNTILGLVAGPFTNAVASIWRGQRAGDYLTAADQRRHIWHAWLAAGKAEAVCVSRAAADLAFQLLTFERGATLLEHAFGAPPKGMLRALSRLGPTARAPDVYRALARVLKAGGTRAQILLHADEIEDSVILGLDAVPEGYTDVAPLLRLFKKRQADATTVSFLVGSLQRLQQLKGAEVGPAILSAANPLEAVWEEIETLPFPKPPWPANDMLAPVRSREELRRIGEELRNCLRGSRNRRQAVLGVIGRARYYYELAGEPGIAEFIRIAPLGWYLRQLRGPDNRRVSESVREKLMRGLAGASGFCGVCDDAEPHVTEMDLLAGLI